MFQPDCFKPHTDHQRVDFREQDALRLSTREIQDLSRPCAKLSANDAVHDGAERSLDLVMAVIGNTLAGSLFLGSLLLAPMFLERWLAGAL